VVKVNGKSLLKPFPSWAMNKVGDWNALQYVQSMEIDNTGRMWIIDVGRLNIFSKPSDVVNGPSKLLIYNLVTKEIERVYVFPHEVAPYDSSFLNDIVVDQSRGFAYISDTGGDGAIILYDYTFNHARRWKGTSAEKGVAIEINGIAYPEFKVPVDGIALSPDGETLYYCPLTGVHLWTVPTRYLRDFKLADKEITRHALDLGEKESQSDGLAISDNGLLYFGLLSKNTINVWDPKTKDLSTQKHLLSPESETLQWVDTFGFDQQGSLLFTTNRLQLFFANTMDWSGASGANFRIMKIDIQGNSYLTHQGPYHSPCVGNIDNSIASSSSECDVGAVSGEGECSK